MNGELQTGGTIGLVTAILAALWKVLPVLISLRDELKRKREIEEAKLVQEHRRDTRRRRSTSPPLVRHSKMPSVDVSSSLEFGVEESTDIEIILDEIRKPPRPRGERPPRRGTHHDRSNGED